MYDLLTVHGYRVLSADNGESGVRSAREEQPDLILMDIQMPIMDGIAAIKTLREDPLTRNITVFATTAYALPEDVAKIVEAGFSHYIVKPIDTRELIKTLTIFFAAERGGTV